MAPIVDVVAAEGARMNGAPHRPVALVIDDDDDIRSWLELSLSLRGWTVVAAASADVAVDAWQTSRPDVVILDDRLPGTTGLECAARLRELSAETRIILFSGYLDAERLGEARRLGTLPLSKIDRDALFRLLDVLYERAVATVTPTT